MNKISTKVLQVLVTDCHFHENQTEIGFNTCSKWHHDGKRFIFERGDTELSTLIQNHDVCGNVVDSICEMNIPSSSSCQ